MQPPTGCEDFDDYVEDGRVAAERDAQREQARRFEEMSGCDLCNAQEREIARLTKALAEAQNTIGEMEEEYSKLESERNQINREREKARDLKRIYENPQMLEIGRKAIEDVLIELRDSRISMMTRGNGLVIREVDGNPSSIIRLGPEDALRIGLKAINGDRTAKGDG